MLAGRWRDEHAGKLLATIRHLQAKGVTVTVLSPIVEYEGEFPALLARAMKTDRLSEMDRYRVPDLDALDRRLAALIRPTGATYVSMQQAECRPDNERSWHPTARCSTSTTAISPAAVRPG